MTTTTTTTVVALVITIIAAAHVHAHWHVADLLLGLHTKSIQESSLQHIANLLQHASFDEGRQWTTATVATVRRHAPRQLINARLLVRHLLVALTRRLAQVRTYVSTALA